jgi:hypothetical protein
VKFSMVGYAVGEFHRLSQPNDTRSMPSVLRVRCPVIVDAFGV